MKVSKKGLDLIKKEEGFRNHPYLDTAGVATIGYGNTYYQDGRKVKLNDTPITMSDATELLCDIVDEFEKGVHALTASVSLCQNQFDALVSFAYNVGLHAFSGSTLLKRILKDPNDKDIDYQFSRWNKAGGVESKGLKKRRNRESWLYFEHLR